MNHLLIFLSMEDIRVKIQGYVDEALKLITGNGFVDVIIQLTATLILFLAVRFLLWNKVTAILEKRKENFDNAMKEKEDALNKAKEVSLDCEAKILDAKKESMEIINAAKERSYKEAEMIIVNAKDEAKTIINKAHDEIEKDKLNANEEIKKEIIDVAFLMASKITEKEIDKNSHSSLVDSFMKDVK